MLDLIIEAAIIAASCGAVYSFGSKRRYVMAAAVSVGTLPLACHFGLLIQLWQAGH